MSVAVAVSADRSQPPTGRLVALSPRDRALFQGWRELTREAPPFLTPEFLTLGAGLAAPSAPLVATAWDGERLSGALPLFRDGRTLHALRGEHNPWFDLAGAPDAPGMIEGLYAGLLDDPGWDRLILHGVPADSPLVSRLPTVALRGLSWTIVREERRSPFFVLPRFEERIAHKHLQNLHRCERKLGELQLERYPRYDRAALRAGLAIEAMAWKRAAGTSIDADAATLRFYTAVARLFGRRGQLSLEFLRAGERRIAFLFGLEDRRGFYALKVGYDPAFLQLSPGHLLVLHSAREAERRGLEEFHFLGHEAEWKRRWTTRSRGIVTVLVYRGNARGIGQLAMHEVVKARLGERARLMAVRARLEVDRRQRRCQREDTIGEHTLVERLEGRIRSGLGLRSGLRRVLAEPHAGSPPAVGAASRFAVGDRVRVLDADRVRAGLDARSRLRGLQFVEAQWASCGRVHEVRQHVRRIVDDHGAMRAISGTVILDGATCCGDGPGLGCGRHCPLFFRDEWLEPAGAAPDPEARAPPIARARVRSVAEIRATLGEDGRRDGLSFMPEMTRYAGQELGVLQRLARVYEHDRWTDARAAIYLLEGARCSGHHLGDDGPCDRGCALLWHVDWLDLSA